MAETMKFREAVERLTERPTRRELAEAIGVSYHAVRQGLLPNRSAAFRPPPKGWPETVAQLARREAARLTALADELEREGGDDGTRTG